MNGADAWLGLTGFLADPLLAPLLLAGVLAGLIFGILPGIGGKLALTLALPFVLDLTPMHAAVVLLALHAVVHTGGAIPAILLGVPGSGADAALVPDGHAMARRGLAGRALGASLGASCFGGLVGAVGLVLLLPFATDLVRMLGPVEQFLLAVCGLLLIAAVSGSAFRAGLIVGCIGIVVGSIGLEPITGSARFAGDSYFLWDGVDLVTVILGVFALPEALALDGVRPSGAQNAERTSMQGVRRGLGDVFRYRWLSFRASLIGLGVGIVPGMGGESAAWLAYAHAGASDRSGEFGQGRVEGVLAPGAANNAKEGGSLVATLFLGIPGSSGMAVMLGAFASLGISPGFWVYGPDLVPAWQMIWTLILANLLAVILFLLGARWMLGVVRIPTRVLFPLVVAALLTACSLSGTGPETLLILLLAGALGCGLKAANWPRAPFAIGVMLGPQAEISLYQATQIATPGDFLTPGPLALLALALLVLVGVFVRRRIRTPTAVSGVIPWLVGSLLLLVLIGLWQASGYPLQAAAWPSVALLLALILLAAEALTFWRGLRQKESAPSPDTSGSAATRTEGMNIGISAVCMCAAVSGVVLLGLPIALPGFVALYLWQRARTGWITALGTGSAVFSILYWGFQDGFGFALPAGLLVR